MKSLDLKHIASHNVTILYKVPKRILHRQLQCAWVSMVLALQRFTEAGLVEMGTTCFLARSVTNPNTFGSDPWNGHAFTRDPIQNIQMNSAGYAHALFENWRTKGQFSWTEEETALFFKVQNCKACRWTGLGNCEDKVRRQIVNIS